MRIVRFSPSQSEVERFGLKSLDFRRLGRVVVLAGPNGGGKSRTLACLQSHLTRNTRLREQFATLPTSIAELQKAIANNRNNPAQALTIERWTSRLVQEQQQLARINSLQFDPTDPETVSIVNFVPKNLDIADPYKKASATLKQAALSAQEPGIDATKGEAGSYIQYLQNLYWEVTHPNYSDSAEHKQKVFKDYQHLLELLSDLLKTKLARDVEGRATLFNKPIAEANLSDGQKVLLQLAVEIHKEASSTPLILLMDEPENHLHPSALLEIFDLIHTRLVNAQVWIATHSVSLLAHANRLEPGCIWYVNEGVATFSGRNPQVVLEGLVGNEDARQELIQFIDMPEQLAITSFAAECLLPPSVAPFASGDPQHKQIWRLSESMFPSAKSLNVLDVGAGKGRLLGSVLERGMDALKRLNYIAFDEYEEDRQLCERQITAAYGTSDGRWYSNQDDLLSNHPEHSFHVVVLCNVLHEIPPSDWTTLFSTSELIYRSLSPDGFLMIVEDLKIPVGEKPNSAGFFLLDTAHLQTLFEQSTAGKSNGRFSFSADQNGRLKAHAIGRELLPRVTRETRRKAILELESSCKRNIVRIREQVNPTYKLAREAAFWSQQLANCVLALQQL